MWGVTSNMDGKSRPSTISSGCGGGGVGSSEGRGSELQGRTQKALGLLNFSLCHWSFTTCNRKGKENTQQDVTVDKVVPPTLFLPTGSGGGRKQLSAQCE